jgi:mannosyltransferase
MNTPTYHSHGTARVLLLLAAILALGTFCRLYGLDKQSLDADELYTIPASAGHHYRFQSNFRQPERPVSVELYRDLLTPDGGSGLGEVTDVLKRNVHAPFYFYLMHYWIEWFGTSEVALRLPSAAFGVAAIFVIFLLGRELFGAFVGLFSSALMGLLPEQVYQSINARMYSLLVLLVLSSTYALVLLLRRRREPWLYLLYGLISVAGLYTHYAYVFCFASQTLYVWLLLRRRKELSAAWVITQLCVGLSFLPWLFIVSSQEQTSGEALSWVSGGLPAREIVPAMLEKVALLTSAPEVPLGRLGQLAAFILLLFGVRTLLHARSTLLLLGLWIILPVAGILLADALKGTRAITATRYWIGVSPALYLFISVGARELSKTFGQVTLVAALCILLSAAGVYTAAGSLRRRPYDFRELTGYVESRIQDADEEVVLTEGSAAMPLALAYYGRRDIQVWRLNFGLGEPSEREFVEAMRGEAAGRRVVWLLSYYTDGAARALEEAGFRRDDSQPRPVPQNVQRFVKE